MYDHALDGTAKGNNDSRECVASREMLWSNINGTATHRRSEVSDKKETRLITWETEAYHSQAKAYRCQAIAISHQTVSSSWTRGLDRAQDQ